MDVKELKSGDKIQSILIKTGLSSIEQISNKVINSFNKILESNKAILKMEQIENKFKEKMIQNWKEDINQIWIERQLNDQIVKINSAKLNARTDNRNAWRPFGKTIDKQTQTQRLKAMNAYIRNLEDMLKDQTSDLQAMIMEVDSKRNFLNELSKRRQNINRQMEVEIAELEDAFDEWQ